MVTSKRAIYQGGLLLELNYHTNNGSCDSGVPPVDHHMRKLQLTCITLNFLLFSLIICCPQNSDDKLSSKTKILHFNHLQNLYTSKKFTRVE